MWFVKSLTEYDIQDVCVNDFEVIVWILGCVAKK